MKRALILGAGLLMAFGHPVRADTRGDILASFNRCGVFADDRTWLNCIYGSVQPMRGKLGLPPAPASQINLVPSTMPMPQGAPPQSTPPSAPPMRQREGGESFLSFVAGGQRVLSNVPLTAYSMDRDGLFTITLANGEVWREMAGSPLPHWHGPASHYMASISKGSMDPSTWSLAARGSNIKSSASGDAQIRMSSGADSDHKRGVALHEAGDFHGALAAYDAALTTEPADPKLHYSRANTLAILNRLDDAIAAYDCCLRLDPSHVSARYNRATVHARLQRWADALAGLDQTLSHAPNMADAWNNRAGVLQAMGRHEDALASIAQVLRLRPNDAAACYNAGIMLLALSRFEQAVQAFERTLQLNPSHADALGCLGSAALRACDWPRLETLIPSLLAGVSAGNIVVPPLTLLAISDDPALQRRCAEINTRRSFAGTALEKDNPPPLWEGTIYRHQRLRIGYVSSDFCDHPVANQLAGLLEHHDRARFEIIGFANGRADTGAMRQRIVKACDQFHLIGDMGSLEAARLIRELEVDVLVDLNGQTLGWRPSIFKCRPAPVSAAYLGYAGTTGTDFIDYVIGDPHVTPFELAPAMSEKIVQLPHSFWPSDPGLPPPQQISRAEAGLPEKAFVFCCFNSNHKIQPEVFACWMRLLRAVPDSVLWIREGSTAMNQHFRNEAEKRGVEPSRILFAQRMESFAKHLDRMHQADLFLDTFPYNAHATASDALWAGVPVVTCRGRSFAARMAAGFLANLGLQGLVASTLEEYEALALSLAQDPARLAKIRARLWDARTTAPLFDVAGVVGDLERAYVQMVNHVEDGARPFQVASLTM